MKRKLQFFLHGFGSNAAEFRQWWSPGSETCIRFFLEGPEPDRLTSARRWFPFTTTESGLTRGIATAVEAAEQQIRQSLASFGSPEHPIELIGHSQGAMVALELLRTWRFPIRTVSSYAGFLARASRTEFHAQSPATVNIFSSTTDSRIPSKEVRQTVEFLSSSANIEVRHFLTGKLGHAFCREWLELANFSRQR